jgi:hypothetical protein
MGEGGRRAPGKVSRRPPDEALPEKGCITVPQHLFSVNVSSLFKYPKDVSLHSDCISIPKTADG